MGPDWLAAAAVLMIAIAAVLLILAARRLAPAVATPAARPGPEPTHEMLRGLYDDLRG